jgi:2-oxoisovalerate dehydrogenase E1 component
VLAGTATPPWRWKGRPGGLQAPVETLTAAPAPAVPPPRPDLGTLKGALVNMPYGDLTVDSGKFVRWTVDNGASVAKGDVVAEIETDKAVVEIEAPAAGKIAQVVTTPGQTVRMGATIGVVQELPPPLRGRAGVGGRQ